MTTTRGVLLRAYPRSRGGTQNHGFRIRYRQGLSPLARGNRGLFKFNEVLLGPIPARAGEPGRPGLCTSARRAYPRSRGGTVKGPQVWNSSTGLSPLARGNLWAQSAQADSLRPIPARAGEPSCWWRSLLSLRAYPRSRGGTLSTCSVAVACAGLSPLARGNLLHRANRPAYLGPIPARAGEPT